MFSPCGGDQRSTEQKPQSCCSTSPERERERERERYRDEPPTAVPAADRRVCVSLSEGQAAYDQLPDLYKKGVDLALVQLKSHSSIPHHFLLLLKLDDIRC
uniref:Uncharacterized protein n=1 Tax=Anguilla anguilla TaxID=7936 RepID=A0A0E9QTH6_ANGAN